MIPGLCFYEMLIIWLTQAETLDDLYEWKAALEKSLAQAPNAALVIGQNGIFRTEANNTIDGSFNSC